MGKIIKSESLTSQVYRLIKDNIINQKYNEGEILNEREIATELGVSRTPVREALKTLEHENWVEYAPYKGVTVKSMGLDDLSDVFKVRSALEVLSVELAFEHIDDQVIKELKDNLHRQKESVDLDASTSEAKAYFLNLDSEFHSIIINKSNNQLLVRLIDQIRDSIRQFGLNAIIKDHERMEKTIEEHEAIIKALEEKSMSKSLEAMSQHIDATYESAYSYLIGKKQG